MTVQQKANGGLLALEEDQASPSTGGSVGCFLDRKAAVFGCGARLHTIALSVFQTDGLLRPTRDLNAVGRAPVSVSRS